MLYRLRWNVTLACFDPETGEKHYMESIDRSGFIASPVAAGGRIYAVSEEGIVHVIQAGQESRILYSLPLGSPSLSFPGLVQDVIIFRTADRLIAAANNSI